MEKPIKVELNETFGLSRAMKLMKLVEIDEIKEIRNL